MTLLMDGKMNTLFHERKMTRRYLCGLILFLGLSSSSTIRDVNELLYKYI